MFNKIILFLYITMSVSMAIADNGFLYNVETVNTVNSQVIAVNSGDLNNDGKEDVAVLTGKFGTLNQEEDYKLIIYFQNMDGSLLESLSLAAPFTKNFLINDVNNDSLNDIVFPYLNGIKVYLQGSDGTFSDLNISSNKFDLIKSGDLNNDGLLDFVTVNTQLDNYNVNVFIQGNNLSFKKTIYSILKTSLFQIKDVNNDGSDDLILKNDNNFGGDFAIATFNSAGNLESTNYFDFELGGTINNFFIEDINGDNLKDFEIAYVDANENSKIKLLQQNSEMGFEFLDEIDSTFEIDSLKVVDLNNDKINDLIYKNSKLGKLNLLLFNSDMTYQMEEYNIPDSYINIYNTIATKDLNSDSSIDILLPVITEEKSTSNGYLVLRELHKNIVIPHIATEDQWKTFLVFENINKNLARSIVKVFKEDGTFIAKEVYVYGEGSYKMELDEGICGKIEVKEGNPIIKEVFENVENNGKGIAEFYLDNSTSNNLIYLFPQYASENLTWNGLVVTNISDLTANVLLNAFDKNGNLINSNNIIVNPRSRTSDLIGSYFNEIDSSKIAKVTAISDNPISGLIISGNNNEKLLFTKALDTKSETGDLLITHIAKENEGWNTKLIFDSLSDDNESVSIDFYSDGLLIETKKLIIPKNSTYVYDINSVSDDYACGILKNSSSEIFVREGFTNIDDNGGGIAEFMLSKNSSSRVVTTFPFNNSDITWEGLALFNPTNLNQNVLVYAKGSNGLISSSYLLLNPKENAKFLLTDFFNQLDSEKITEISSIQLFTENKVSSLNISGAGTSRLLFGNGVAR